jgi:hypothetical protein
MKILHVTTNDPHLHGMEKFYVYKETKCNQLNDKYVVGHSAVLHKT